MPLQPARLEFTPDGTPFSSAFGDVYHSTHGGPAQARHVFLGGNDLPARWQGRLETISAAPAPGISPEERAAFEQEMRAGGVDWQLHLYGGVVHSFTNPDADARGMPEFLRYDATADARSWAAMHALLDEALA